MKYINKKIPDFFQNWKPKINQRTIPKTIKQKLHKHLLEEQGCLCCYCERRIEKRNSHIEYFRPQSLYKDSIHAYENLLLSCDGREEGQTTGSQEHCGPKKGDWFKEQLMVSPLDEYCAGYFHYTGAGEILAANIPEKQLAAETTIEKCQLNHSRLVKHRKKALEPYIIELSLEEVSKLDDLKKCGANGKYTPFCTAIIYYIENNNS